MNATELIEFIESENFTIHRYELFSEASDYIRSAMRRMCTLLQEEKPEIASKVRLSALKFNTSPFHPFPEMLSRLRLDDFTRVCDIWGEDLAKSCFQFEIARDHIEKNGSLMQRQLVKVLSDHIAQEGLEKIKIWCHRQEKSLYVELMEIHGVSLSDDNFICSSLEYRKSPVFGCLIRIGPLREFGWSKFPSIVLSAPRYRNLIQLVWSGSVDSDECGKDQIIGETDYKELLFTLEKEKVVCPLVFETGLTSDVPELVDDLVFFREQRKKVDLDADCWLVDLGQEGHILLAPGSKQLVFELDSDGAPVKETSLREIETGNYLILHNIEVDLGKTGYQKAKLAPRWKKALYDMYTKQYMVLMGSMKNAGIDLKALDAAVMNWISYEGGTIHAPQSVAHFRNLIKDVLPSNCLGGATWQQAWHEIATSRGKAREEGRLVADIVYEELVELLNSQVGSLRKNASGNNCFNYVVNRDGNLFGSLKFCRVEDFLQGFHAPRDRLGTLGQEEDFELYRMDF